MDTAADRGGLGQFPGDIQSWDATISNLLAIKCTLGFDETGSGGTADD